MFAARNMTFAGSAFTPLSLSPALWLDGSDSNTLYDSTSGGSPVAPDGSIARWEDKSGNGRHATQGTAINRPVRKVAEQNGKDVVLFDGSNDEMVITSAITTATYTLYAVINRISGSNYQTILTNNGATAGTWISSKKTNLYFGADHFSNTAQTDDTYYLLAVTSSLSGNLISFYTNGSADGTHSLAPSFIHNALGGHSSEYFNGYFSEILLFPTVLDANQRTSVDTYLNAKWGIY